MFAVSPSAPQLLTGGIVFGSVRVYGATHYATFRTLLHEARPKKLLILGVYFGCDIAFFLKIAKRLNLSLSVVGVDKFSDDACGDWPEKSKSLTWQQAGFGKPPSLQTALANVKRYGNPKLIKAQDGEFMSECKETFDCIYLDTSHDYETVHRQIRQAAPLLNPNGFLFGDDYSNEGTWGVQRAVTELLPDHEIYNKVIWLSRSVSHL